MAERHPPHSGRTAPDGLTRSTGEEESARLVDEVLEAQARRKRRREEASGSGKRRVLPLPVVAVFWGIVCLVAWIATPSILLPEPVPEPEPTRVEAGLRMQMLALVSEIEEYRTTVGRAPRLLSEVPAEAPAGVDYVRLSSTGYRLVGQWDEIEIVYRSGTPTGEFLGDARQQIQRRRGEDS